MASSTRPGMEVARALGANVRRLRLEGGISAVELAARSGIARATLTALEGGRANPTVETIAALAGALACEPETLLRRESGPRVKVVRDGAGRRTSEIASLVDRHGHAAGRTEVYDLRLPAGGRERSTSHGRGSTEIVLVREGGLRVGPIGTTVELRAGDYAAFATDCLHEYAAPDAAARFWLIGRFA